MSACLLLGESSFLISSLPFSHTYTHTMQTLSHTQTSPKFQRDVIHLKIGSRTSKSFYKYSSGSPDNHKINLQNHTQHCSANSSNMSNCTEKISVFLFSFFSLPVGCGCFFLTCMTRGEKRETDIQTEWKAGRKRLGKGKKGGKRKRMKERYHASCLHWAPLQESRRWRAFQHMLLLLNSSTAEENEPWSSSALYL